MSSFSTKALRGSLRRAASCPRYASSQASSSAPPSSSMSSSPSKLEVQPKQKLAEEKLRVLVNLYHQTATFITKENLDKRIDEAFIESRQHNLSALGVEAPFRALEIELAHRRSLPKFGMSRKATPLSTNRDLEEGEAWSDRRTARERAIITTLYGVVGRGKPAYDTLKDEEQRIKRQLKADREGS
ncbi:hypothetical protein BV20DRAFT_305595 [Pilatotrama ljubarskyi]|nr:hypothetical protein BV20DRAFT_305595 [Pilatotrama ljubarskyi]